MRILNGKAKVNRRFNSGHSTPIVNLLQAEKGSYQESNGAIKVMWCTSVCVPRRLKDKSCFPISELSRPLTQRFLDYGIIQDVPLWLRLWEAMQARCLSRRDLYQLLQGKRRRDARLFGNLSVFWKSSFLSAWEAQGCWRTQSIRVCENVSNSHSSSRRFCPVYDHLSERNVWRCEENQQGSTLSRLRRLPLIF